MLSAAEFHELVSGRRRGVRATLLRGLLRVAEGPYTAAVRWRNRQFDRGRRAIEAVGVPVVSVGNITLGGTGKTPLVEWLARWFRARGLRVALVSRGYGAEAGSRNDEALELEQKLPDVPHVQNPDRVAAARLAIEEFESQLILLDDGYQHRRIRRDLDIVVLDALEPFGFEHVFPRGTLREPLSGLKRADVLVLSRADLVAAEERERIRTVATSYAPAALWVEAAHAPRTLVSASGSQAPLDIVRGKPVAAFCGLGNPAGFRRTLDGLGCQLLAFREFPDHHSYSRGDVESLAAWAAAQSADAVLCTHKDLVKLGVERLGPLPLWAVVIGLDILKGSAELEARLSRLSTELG